MENRNTMLSIVNYTVTVTTEIDEDFRKYLARKLQADLNALNRQYRADALPLDISLDDSEGDVVAGISSRIEGETLMVDMLWVERRLRRRGMGQRLLHMAEEIAYQRGCTRVRICAADDESFYTKQGYCVTGKLKQFPQGNTILWLTKDLGTPDALCEMKGPA
ncbi:MAG: hypothetical protein OHK0046_35210 [Anaerolineae bacterium]